MIEPMSMPARVAIRRACGVASPELRPGRDGASAGGAALPELPYPAGVTSVGGAAGFPAAWAAGTRTAGAAGAPSGFFD
ncbi:MAG TPA: hypothetical protein VN905_16135, partial [Candidatus Binatia bacterium]|nr:hypothetical protein [Candidatus Binatia bacterium]